MLQPIDPSKNIPIPALTTRETELLREDYPCVEHLEAGNVAPWLMERQDQLLVRAKDERVGMNLAKLVTLSGTAVGAVFYAASPLALIGAAVAGVGYVWTIAQDLNDSHQFAPLPFIRGNILEFIEAMGDKDLRDAYFASRNELVELMQHLPPMERYEFGMLKAHTHTLTDFLAGVQPGKRFYAYRWLLDWFINLRGDFPTRDELQQHLSQVSTDTRLDYEQVGAIANAIAHTPTGIQAAQSQQKAIAPAPTTLDGWLAEKINSEPEAIDVESTPVESGTTNPQASLHPDPLIAQIGQSILDTLTILKAPAQFGSGVESNKFYRVLIRPEPTSNINTILGSSRSLYSQLGLILPEMSKPPIVSQVMAGKVAVDVPKPKSKWTKAYFKNYIVPARKSFESPVNLLIGVDMDAQLVEMILNNHGTHSMIVGGLPGGGKSNFSKAAISAIICQYTPESVKLVLSDVQQVEFQPFKKVPHLLFPIASTAVGTVTLLQKTVEEMDKRQSLFAAEGVVNLDEYNAKVAPDRRLPRVLVFIEETEDIATCSETFVRYTADREELVSYADEFNYLRGELARLGRKWGFHIFDSTQSPRADVIPAKVRDKFAAFLAFMVNRPEISKIILGGQFEDAMNLLGEGDAMWMTSLGLERVQCLYITNEEIAQIVQRVVAEYGEFNPRRQTTAASPHDGEGTARVWTEPEDSSSSGSSSPSSSSPSSSSSSPSSSSSSSSPSSTVLRGSSSSGSGSSPVPPQNRSLKDFEDIKNWRNQNPPVGKGAIIKQRWKYKGEDYKLGDARYLAAIEEHGGDWIRELWAEKKRIREIVNIVFSISRGHDKYQFYAGKVRSVLGLSENHSDEEE